MSESTVREDLVKAILEEPRQLGFTLLCMHSSDETLAKGVIADLPPEVLRELVQWAWSFDLHLNPPHDPKDFFGSPENLLECFRTLRKVLPAPLEIERKFVVLSILPEAKWPAEAVPESKSRIVQTYLTSADTETTERIRCRTWSDDTTTLTHTIKKHVSAGVNEESERGLSSGEYAELLERKDPDRGVVTKTRQVVRWAGHKLEIDTFHGYLKGLVLLEVELPSMSTPLEIPDFIQVKEVTEDKEYSNAALAKRSRFKQSLDPESKEPVKLVTREEIQEALAKVDQPLHARHPGKYL